MTQRTLAEIARAQLRTRPAAGPIPPPAAAPSRNGKAAPKVEVYYDSEKKTFWVQNSRGEWVDTTESALKRLLRVFGYSKDRVLDNGLTEVEQALFDIQHNQDVHYAGPLAGFPIGPRDCCGQRILVTRAGTPIQAKEGDHAFLAAFFADLLKDQVQNFNGWMKAALQSLRAGPPFRPGQLLGLAGPAGCGKSLLQGLITEVLGGRVAKPYRYMTGETPFNSDLFSAEHLAIEDEAASTDLRIRRFFGSQLKTMIVNEVQSYHRKSKEALPLSPFWRVSLSVNDEPENLMVLPPIDDSLRDKITLLQCHAPPNPIHGDDPGERQRFRRRLSDELPGWVAWLMRWRIPDRMKDARYGVKAFQDPALLWELDNLAPEFRLLSLVDTAALWDQGTGYWEGTAATLERALREWDKTGEVARLLGFNTACGVYLGRLASKKPDRVTREKKAGNSHVYRVNQPPDKSLFKSSVFL